MTFITRRNLLKRAGLLSAAAAVAQPDILNGTGEAGVEPLAVTPAQAATSREALEHLTSVESEILEAVVARLVPTDANGPGASEARAAHYIDHALGSALASSRPAYASGLTGLDQYARSARGKPFAQLSVADQDALLTDVESGAASNFPGSAEFFAMVRAHAIQGTFCDPYYGGNANFVGWDLVGYPGVRTTVDPEEQRLGIDVPPNHKSAYDYEMFTKASASAARQPPGVARSALRPGGHHGD